jgi:hypothetical protein
MFFSNLVDSLLLQTFLGSHFFHFNRDCEKKHIQCHNITSFKGSGPTKRHKKAAESYVLLRVFLENIKRPQDKTLLPAAAMSE